MTEFRGRPGWVRAAVAAPVLMLALSACGGSDSSISASGSTTAPSATSAAQAGRGGLGGNFQAIQACLTAAGISIPTPSGRPSGRPSGLPNGQPPGEATPSGAPNGTRPSGGFRGGGDGMRQLFQDSKVQAALAACGITVPTGGPRPQATSTS